MSTITLMRTEQALPSNLDSARMLLTGAIDGFSQDDKRAWRRFLKRLVQMGQGELAVIDARMPRSGPFHRFHMRIEQAVFEAQERFHDFDQFRVWLKVGAGWVDWCAGPKGGVVPIPKSISYAKADEEEFRRYHDLVMSFLRSGHAARFLWKHLGEQADAMMESVLEGVNP